MIKSISAVAGRKQVKPVKGEETLVHDGKRIIVRHGPEATTGSGNPKHIMVTGSAKDIDAEAKRLNLAATTDPPGNPKSATITPLGETK